MTATHQCLRVLALCGALLASTNARSEQVPSAATIDHIELAAKLLSDGHFNRAAQLLAEVDAQGKDIDRERLFTLRGVLYLEQKQYIKSRDSFNQAIAEGSEAPIVYFYLARAHFGSQEHTQCISALTRSGKHGKTRVAYLMAAQSNWQLGRHEQAIAVLSEGIAELPDESDLMRRKIFFLVELKLYQQVLSLSRHYLARAGVSVDDYVAIGEALRAGGSPQAAQLVLEEAHLKFPDSEEIALQLAHAYLQDANPATAAQLFEALARSNSKYYLEAAETFKQAGRIARAYWDNAQILDQKAKLKQRLSLLLADERFEEIAAMAPALARTELHHQDAIRYALAFAYYNTGQLSLAESNLTGFDDPEIFNSALELRRAIDQCREAGWECGR